MMQGAFYPSSTIISQDEAWDMIEEYYHADIEAEIQDAEQRLGDYDTAREHVLFQWHKLGISHYEGFFQRRDGLVEVEKYD